MKPKVSTNANAKVGLNVAFTPKGGCPLKLEQPDDLREILRMVAFTPKGGCPLKHLRVDIHASVHIQ